MGKPGLAIGAASRWSRPEGRWALAWALLCLPWLLGFKVIPFDAVQQFFPAVSFSAEQVLQGQMPWWNPYLFGGYPQIADPQMMTLQPSMVLPMLLAPQSLHLFTVVVLLHVLAGGFGALRLAKLQGMSPQAQLMFALVLMFGGVAAARLQHTPMIVSYSLLPWLWLGLLQLCRRGHARDVLLAGIAGGLIALQLTQVTYFIILACAVYSIWALLTAGARRAGIAWRLIAVAGIAGALSAPQWLSTLAWLDETNRSGLLLEDAQPGALHWQSLATLLSGNVFAQGRGDSWAFGDITTDYLYVGAVPLMLWLMWGGEVLRRRPHPTRTALAVVVISILVALGSATPLFPWLFGWLPGFDLFRRPSDALFLFVPAAAWLGAQALDVGLERAPLRPHVPSIGMITLLLVATVWLIVRQGRFDGFAWLAISLGIGVAAVQLLRRHAVPGRWLAALMLFDLLLFNVSTAFNAGSATKSVLTADRAGPAQSVYALLAPETRDGLPERAVVFGIPAVTNGAAVHALPLANGYNPLLARDYADMVGMPSDPFIQLPDKPPTSWAPDFDAPLYGLLGVRWLLAQQPFPGAQAQGESLHVIRRDDVLPRVLNPRAIARHPGRFPPAAAFKQTDFRTTLWLPEQTHAGCSDTNAGEARVMEMMYRPGRVRLRVEADAPAWVVVNEVTASGWTATRDGQPTALLRGNGLFQALCVPAGTHVVELRYSPFQLWREGLAQRLRAADGV